ncbi:hypothetical protein [Azospirillum sp.]|uniref:tetratricopeptide repeat protein n=1 Tax=Azospirillum sp. TaxID=34012 RepID=UPI002D31C034|nr:hypothetical protein [Azospirillum sp.]HYD71042.1 hypothetical protein [Azospirillum sp.]
MRAFSRMAAVLPAVLAAGPALADDLSYHGYADRREHPFACQMAYYADKTGDHPSAITILEDCIAQGNVWSMIWMAMLHENGQGVPKSLEASAALMERAASMRDPAGYASLARYHWGMALLEGRGVPRDEAAAAHWLRLAAAEGVPEAAEALGAMTAR